MTIWAVDQDPCTGEETDRLLTTATVDAGAARFKWKVDIPRGTNIGLYTRNYRIKIGDEQVTSDNIRAGQYIQPVTEWIFPELVTPGGTPPPFDFSNIGPLRNGFGPIDGTIFKQLSPWPGANAPTPLVATCPDPPSTTSSSTSAPTSSSTSTPTPGPPVALVASAGSDQLVLSGVSVTLSASQLTSGISNSDLKYNWTQIAGPSLALSATNTASINISPPVVAIGQSVQREFRIVITHSPSGSKANDTVVVTSDRLSSHFDEKVIDSLTWASKQSGTATATAHTNLVDPAASMRIIFGTGAEQPMVRASTSNGRALYTFSNRNINRYTSATIRSYINNVLVQGPVVTSTNVGAG